MKGHVSWKELKRIAAKCSRELRSHRKFRGVLISFFVIFAVLPIYFRSERGSIFRELRQMRISKVILEEDYQYLLSACVITRESSELLPEFLIRNYAAGIDHFFIYGDDDDQEEKLRLKQIFDVLDDLVTYVPDGRNAPEDDEDPENYVQMRMYRHCLRKFGPRSKWVALIDTDEFFETDSLPFNSLDRAPLERRAFMHDVLTAHDMFPILCVRWKTALTNGRVLSPKRGETLDDLFPATCQVRVNNKEKLALRKALLQPRFLNFKRSPRLDVAIHKGFKFKGEKRRIRCTWGIGRDLEPPIHIVHYWSRDLSSYLRKIRRGRPRKGVPSRNLADLFLRESMCVPERLTGSSSSLRREYVRRQIKRMPHFGSHKGILAEPRQAIGMQDNSSEYLFCETRVSLFISKLSSGMQFSNQRYCKGRLSEACTNVGGGEVLWPFPWAEFLLTCDNFSRDSSFFV